jgi:4-hydroxy-tetrahydrodipicolinate synthase
MGKEFMTAVTKNPLIAGIKESSGDYSRLPFLTRNFPTVELVVGGEEQVLEFAAWGAKAWVCASANFFPSECARFIDIISKQGDFDRGEKIMSAFMPLMQILEQGGKFLQCVKYGCELQGRPGGAVRPPLLPMDDVLKQEMADIVVNTREWVNSILKQETD